MNNVPPKKIEQKEEIAVNETIVILQQSNNVQFYDVTTPAPNTSNTTTNNNNNLSKANYGINVMQLKVGNAIAFIITLIFNYISSAGLISPYGIGTICEEDPLLASKINIVGTTSMFEMIVCFHWGVLP